MSRPRVSSKLSEAEVVQGLLAAYRRGYFPMAEDRPFWDPAQRTHIHWLSPDPRGILPLTEQAGLHVPERLERTIRSGRFIVRTDTAFEQVMRGCALPRKAPADEPGAAEGTWIDQTLIEWYSALFRAGHAHSVEAWRRDPESGREHLVGGVYGVSIGAAFFGESMFHIALPKQPCGTRHPLDGTDASKVCLVKLVRAMHRAGYELFDTQMVTAHVARLGGREIPRHDYLNWLDSAASGPDRWAGVRL